MKRLLITIFIGLILTGCSTQSGPPNILENPICDPPCWENITPGVTKKTDALIILSKITSVDQPIVDSGQTFLGFDDVIRFTFYKDPNKRGFVYILGDRVSMIGFDYKMDVTLQAAIELIGTPQNILVINSGEIYAATLLNPEKGFAISCRIPVGSDEIRTEDEIESITYFDPKNYQLLLDTGILSYHQLNAQDTSKLLRPWEGFGNIEKYSTPLQP